MSRHREIIPEWRLYASQMIKLGYGVPLWQPAPLHNYERVQVGDVGYVREGRFHLLFSAGVPLGSRVKGVDVPSDFEYLDVGPVNQDQPRKAGPAKTAYIQISGGDVDASLDLPTTVVSGSIKFAFQASSTEGAILMTRLKTYRDNAERMGRFKKYILCNHKSWVQFANDEGHGIHTEDLLLVTGRDMTEDFSMIAFSHNERRFDVQFEAGAPLLASASASVWGSWQSQLPVYENWGPQEREPSLDGSQSPSPSVPTSSPQYNQCVFLRGYRIYRRAKLLPTVIRAAAGPHDLPPGDDSSNSELPVGPFDPGVGSDTESICPSGVDGVSISCTDFSVDINVPLTYDPLAELGKYILQNSEANLALVHDDDWSALPNLVRYSSEQDMGRVLSHIRPLIHSGDEVSNISTVGSDTHTSWYNMNDEVSRQLERFRLMWRFGGGRMVHTTNPAPTCILWETIPQPLLPSHNALSDPEFESLRFWLDHTSEQCSLDAAMRDLIRTGSLLVYSFHQRGNEIVSEIFARCSVPTKAAALNSLLPNFPALCTNENGLLVVQEIIDCLTRDCPTLLNDIRETLVPFVVPLLTDQYGRHIAQWCFYPAINNHLFVALANQILRIALDPIGAPVLIHILTTTSTADISIHCKNILAIELLINAPELASDSNGVLLLEWFLNSTSPSFPSRFSLLSTRLISTLSLLCSQPHSCSLLLKIINQREDPPASQELLNAIFSSRTLMRIMTSSRMDIHASIYTKFTAPCPRMVFFTADEQEYIMKQNDIGWWSAYFDYDEATGWVLGPNELASPYGPYGPHLFEWWQSSTALHLKAEPTSRSLSMRSTESRSGHSRAPCGGIQKRGASAPRKRTVDLLATLHSYDLVIKEGSVLAS